MHKMLQSEPYPQDDRRIAAELPNLLLSFGDWCKRDSEME
jgi:hypothetical protein